MSAVLAGPATKDFIVGLGMTELEEARRVRDEWCAEYVKVRDALKGLIDRLDEIHEDPAYKSVWTVHQIHVGPYRGPTYVDAVARAREALA